MQIVLQILLTLLASNQHLCGSADDTCSKIDLESPYNCRVTMSTEHQENMETDQSEREAEASPVNGDEGKTSKQSSGTCNADTHDKDAQRSEEDPEKPQDAKQEIPPESETEQQEAACVKPGAQSSEEDHKEVEKPQDAKQERSDSDDKQKTDSEVDESPESEQQEAALAKPGAQKSEEDHEVEKTQDAKQSSACSKESSLDSDDKQKDGKTDSEVDGEAESPEEQQEASLDKPALKKKEKSEIIPRTDKEESLKAEDNHEDDKKVFDEKWNKIEYDFNAAGQFRHKKSCKPFEFKVYDDVSKNQKRYEEIGELVTEYVFHKIEENGLKKITVPTDVGESEPASFFFASTDYDKKAKLLILIHGSGVVQAGQWTRKLIINEDLHKGTQLPYIKWGEENDYGVIVLNTNRNSIKTKEGRRIYIRENQSPEEHANYVWKNFIAKTDMPIVIVAHSYGGVVTTHLAQKLPDFQKRVFAIAFTDSVHSLGYQRVSRGVQELFTQHAVNWVTSDKPLGKNISNATRDAQRVSAGDLRHEWTSYSAMKAVFEFIHRKFEAKPACVSSDSEDPATKPSATGKKRKSTPS